MTTATKPSDYVEIAKWHERTSSRYYYIEHVQRRAFAEKAPLNAIFYSDTENRWITTDDTAESQAEARNLWPVDSASRVRPDEPKPPGRAAKPLTKETNDGRQRKCLKSMLAE